MFKVLIADDEPKIRRGLQNAFNWEDMNMLVVGTAKDGEEALQMVREKQPDICLVDICMPRLSGLDMIEKIREEIPGIVMIVVTGHNEFQFAHKALKLQVFEYILKPVCEDELLRVLIKAKVELEERDNNEKRLEIINEKLQKSLPILKHVFIRDWLNGSITKDEIEDNLQFHDMKFERNIGIVLLKTNVADLGYKPGLEEERQLFLSAIQDIFEEQLIDLNPYVITRDENENLVAICSIINDITWSNLLYLVEAKVDKRLGHKVTLYKRIVESGIEGINIEYENIKKDLYNEKQCLPVVKKIKSYIEENYANPNFQLQDVAENMGMSLAYLSKLFKHEVGISFVEYLTKHRINKAIYLLKDPLVKIYEVADKVGYSSQHYFCEVFKKVLNVSPSEYRKKETS
jgi:two-component system, response regulator YesN